MSYTLTTLDDGHIILLTMEHDFIFPDDMIQSLIEGYEFLESGPDGICLIVDSRNVQFDSLDKILGGGQAARSPESKRFQAHPKYLKALSVTSGQVVKLMVKGFNTASFGHLEILMFDTLEETVNYARKLTSEARKTG